MPLFWKPHLKPFQNSSQYQRMRCYLWTPMPPFADSVRKRRNDWPLQDTAHSNLYCLINNWKWLYQGSMTSWCLNKICYPVEADGKKIKYAEYYIFRLLFGRCNNISLWVTDFPCGSIPHYRECNFARSTASPWLTPQDLNDLFAGTNVLAKARAPKLRSLIHPWCKNCFEEGVTKPGF